MLFMLEWPSSAGGGVQAHYSSVLTNVRFWHLVDAHFNSAHVRRPLSFAEH